VGLIAALEAIKGAEREAIRREEVRDEAIVESRYLCMQDGTVRSSNSSSV